MDGRLRVGVRRRVPRFPYFMKVRTDGATYRYLLRALPAHVPLHCLWAYGKRRGQLSAAEYSHVEACTECSRALHVCYHAENFGAVLREIHRAQADEPSSDEKPKLKTLYIFPDPFR
jgi:hypothetical protein